ncbi:pyrimidine 5'-nucleotidase [Lentibacter algarum]|uniref:pyrimidine 5'-nucleotidase n=1 Tax=Lentibacter algarum TaxID=576131 RepID=UPI001C0A3D67|nr:pyrimidine 5'-nucleotidase [Lentibacter algarum]MBU2983450.1 pyrimidine 5'-nucleotidase [Lentibacter algarum]
MLKTAFKSVDTWIFDLDNTLYPPHMRLFDQIEVKMIEFVMREIGVSREDANHMRHNYWAQYGTTLAGLMHHHDIDPEPYLAEVHDISFEPLKSDPELSTAIKNLPGRKIIYTNGSAPYAEKVVESRGLAGLFDDIYGVEHASFHPKPQQSAFEQVFTKAAVFPETSAMFEDDPRNLSVPHSMGLRTVLVAPKPMLAEHIHFHTDDLTGFLRNLR